MTSLLVINTSPQGSSSYSRQMTDRFIQTWKRHNPTGGNYFLRIGEPAHTPCG